MEVRALFKASVNPLSASNDHSAAPSPVHEQMRAGKRDTCTSNED